MSEKLASPRQVRGEWAITWMLGGVGADGVTRSYSSRTTSGQCWPLVTLVPANIHAEPSTITMSARMPPWLHS